MEILRPESWSYVSFHSVLSSVALIDFFPPTLTVATFGKEGRYFSNIGYIDFLHVEHDINNPFFTLNIYDSMKYHAKTATPELALYDYMQAGFDASAIDTAAIRFVREDKYPDYGIAMPKDFISPFDMVLNNIPPCHGAYAV